MVNTATRWLIKLTILPPIIVAYMILLALSVIWGAVAFMSVIIVGTTAMLINLSIKGLNNMLEYINQYLEEAL